MQTENYLVIDDLLPPDQWNLLLEQIECEVFEKVNLGFDKVYRFNSGDIFKSVNKLWVFKNKWPNNYGVFQEIFKKALQEIEFLPGIEYEDCSMMVHSYSSGAEIGWHRDLSYFASYSFYAHKNWHPMWGGNLLIADSATKTEEGIKVTQKTHPKTELKDSIGQTYGERGISFDYDFEREILFQPGFGNYIMPVPNRLVLIKNHCFHKVERIDAAAGMNYRVSLTGFFK